ncbi:MAG: hypothetical protein LBE31_12195 [Deltaproteobacteria bacterium]|jgi:MinD-like ATPase involved in chromosome partitioning or flagellar assembly|nr:hypothetical protein [Deltaproteobacteria bacterium]
MSSRALDESGIKRPKAGLYLTDEALMKSTLSLLETGGGPLEASAKISNGDAWNNIPAADLSSLSVAVFDLKDQDNLMDKAKDLLERCEQDTAVIVLGREDNLKTYRRLKAIGVSDYFSYPIQAGELAESVSRLSSGTREKPQATGHIIAVHGVRGGLGSGLLAAGLSVVTAEDYGRQVAVVDSCLSSPTVEGYLGVNTSGNLDILLDAKDRLDKVLLSQAIIRPSERLALLSGQLPPDGHPTVWPDSVKILSSLLAEQYRYQIWRSQSGSPLEAELLAAAKVVVLLTGGALPCARSTKNTYTWLSQNNKSAKVVLVYNQVSPEPTIPPTYLAKALGVEFDLIIPYIKGLGSDLVNEVPLNKKKHQLYKQLTNLAKLIMSQAAPEPPSSWFKFWRR